MITSQQIQDRAGISTKCLHYWLSKGYVGGIEHLPGSGHPRTFSDSDAQHIEMMARLVRAGILPHTAHRAAAELLTYGTASLGGFALAEDKP